MSKNKPKIYTICISSYVPDPDIILKDIIQYSKQGYFKESDRNLSHYFNRKTSNGCLMVEKENDPDAYIDEADYK